MGTRVVGPSPGHLRSPLRSCSRDALFRTAAAKNLKVYLRLAWEKRAKDEKKAGSPGAAAADGPSDEEIPQALKRLDGAGRPVNLIRERIVLSKIKV